jgi:hypothetical protein
MTPTTPPMYNKGDNNAQECENSVSVYLVDAQDVHDTEPDELTQEEPAQERNQAEDYPPIGLAYSMPYYPSQATPVDPLAKIPWGIHMWDIAIDEVGDDGEYKVYGAKYKKVANRTKPIAGTLPDEFR